MERAPLYLASASPRRRELIQALGRPVIVSVAPVDELELEAAYVGASTGLAEYLACQKALAATLALQQQENTLRPGVLVAADTTVLLDGQVLGKPVDAQEAWTMLRALRGRTHQVITGVASCTIAGYVALAEGSQHGIDAQELAGSLRSVFVSTSVLMRDYADSEIAAYVDSGDPLDKAGAYAVQHTGFHPVARIAGCYTSVVGLPLCATAELVARVESETEGAGGDRSTNLPLREGTCPWSPRCGPPFPSFLRET